MFEGFPCTFCSFFLNELYISRNVLCFPVNFQFFLGFLSFVALFEFSSDLFVPLALSGFVIAWDDVMS